MNIFQKTVKIIAERRGYNIITAEVERGIPELISIKAGLAHIMIMHTSASLTINENADPSVRADFESFFNMLIPEEYDLYQHTAEGLDDITSHIKSSILGSSITIPISNGHFKLGTWQGIYLCEHRNRPRQRTLVITIIGE